MKASNLIGGIAVGINTQTGTAYTLALSDAGIIVRMDNAAGNVVTVPLNATVAFDVGAIISVTQVGAGATDIAAEVGVTIQSVGGNLGISAQYGVVTLVKVATDTWMLYGDLAA